MLTALPYPSANDPDIVFAAVAVVCASHAEISGLDHVVKLVNDFVGVHSDWTLTVASGRGYPKLIKILLARERHHHVDMRYAATVCNRGIDIAAGEGRLWVLEDFVRNFPGLVITHAATVAAKEGRLHVVTWLYQQRRQVCWTEDALAEAVFEGHTGVVEFLCNRFAMVPTSYMLEVAVTRNYFDMTEWLWVIAADQGDVFGMRNAISMASLRLARFLWLRHSRNITISIDKAAERGDTRFISWAAGLYAATATTDAIDSAAANGHLGVIEWLVANRNDGFTDAAISLAALGGHLHVIRWMLANTTAVITSAALFNAAIRGHMEVLQWLDQRRGEIDYPRGTFDHACAQGQFEIVEWMTEVGVGHATHRAMDWAAANGQLDMVVWLSDNRAEGCTTDAMDEAPANGHLTLVQWLDANRSEGCTTAAMDEAARFGHFDIIKWLHFNRDEGTTVFAIRNAVQFGRIEIVEWLSDKTEAGCTTDAMDTAIASANIELVEWFLTNRDEGCTPQGMDAAAENGHFEMLEYLHRNQIVECTPAAFRQAVRGKHLYIASWIDYHYRDQVVYGEMNSFFDRHGWTWTVLHSAFS